MSGRRASGGRLGRTATYGFGATAAFAIALLFFTPTTLAAPAGAVVVLSAPYHGTTTGVLDSWSAAGCGSAAVVTKAFFHAHTGLAGFDDRTRSPSCSANPFGASGGASSDLTIDFPVTITAKSTTIVAVATLDVGLHADLTVGACTATAINYSCAGYASAYLTGGFYLYDLTTGAYWFASTLWPGEFLSAYNYTTCYSGTCYNYSTPSESALVDSTIVWSIAATGLSTTDQYVLYAYFDGAVSSSETSYGATITGSLATAGVNAATMGHGIDVDSITIA